MLPTHGRYDYSNITTRPNYAWPGGRRLAVYVALQENARDRPGANPSFYNSHR